MQVHEAYALSGGLSLGTLALLHLLVWRAQRERWAAYSALGHGLLALVFALADYTVPDAGRPRLFTALLAAPAFVLLTLAAIDYSRVPERVAKGLRWACAVGGVAVMGAALLHLLTQAAGFALVSGYLLLQAGLAAWAMRREPRSGHGLVLLALLTFPAALVVALWGGIELGLLRYLVVVPVAVAGMTMLTTGLLRAQRQAHEELARRQQAQAELHALNAALEQRVEQRTAELRNMVEGLESFNRSVSHDLRGPLGGIAGVSRLASEALARGDTATVSRLLPAITAQAESSGQLVSALLALAHIDDGELALQPVALSEVVQQALEQLRLSNPSFEAQALPVQLQALPMVAADPGLLRQVYVNLVGNALKFTRSTPAPHIEIGATVSGGETVLYVRDNGVGFEPVQAERLFQPFQRLHDQRYPGHGVGLSIVRRIVERHGGRVWAESAPGQGAAFFFTLG